MRTVGGSGNTKVQKVVPVSTAVMLAIKLQRPLFSCSCPMDPLGEVPTLPLAVAKSLNGKQFGCYEAASGASGGAGIYSSAPCNIGC